MGRGARGVARLVGDDVDEPLFELVDVGYYGVLWVVGLDVVGWAEEDALVGCLQHCDVVVGVAECHDIVLQAFEGLDGFAFGVGLSEFVVGDASGWVGLEAMAEEEWVFEFVHEWLCELDEGVADYGETSEFAYLSYEVEGAWEWFEGAYDLLDVVEGEVMFVEDAESHLHEFVVVFDVSGGEFKFLDTSFFRHIDPYFGHEDAFEVSANDPHFCYNYRVVGTNIGFLVG